MKSKYLAKYIESVVVFVQAKLNKVERSKSTKIVQSSEKKKRYPDNQDQIITATDRNTKEIRSNNSK